MSKRASWWMHAAAASFAVLSGCRGDFDAETPPEIFKISPSSVSVAEGWRLFDRSVSSGFHPTDKPVEVTFDKVERVTAIKVFGSSPYLLRVRGFDPIQEAPLLLLA